MVEMETFERFDSLSLERTSSKAEQGQLSIAHSLENPMKISNPPPAPLHSKGKAPSSTPDGSLRIALLGCNERSHLTRSLLEHIPGVEMVGITDPRHGGTKENAATRNSMRMLPMPRGTSQEDLSSYSLESDE